MTRDNAIALVKKRHERLSFGSKLTDADFQEIAECDVDNYIALGMLKIDAPTPQVMDTPHE